MEDIDDKLSVYDPGRTENKKDVTKQLETIKIEREKMVQDHIKKETEYNETMTAIHLMTNPHLLQQRVDELNANAKQISEKNKLLEVYYCLLNYVQGLNQLVNKFYRYKDLELLKVRIEKKVVKTVELTDLGGQIKKQAKTLGNYEDRLTPAMLKDSSWQTKRFRRYDD